MATSQRATCWSVTINNPIAADEENIAQARQSGWKVDGQLEKGENGTPHYQLIIKTPQVRFSAVKKQFPRAHIEIARNPAALEEYVHKDDTREALLAQQSDLYPSLQKVWDMFYDWLSLDGNVTHFCSSDEDRRLTYFDEYICEKIEEGYVLETIAVNPQIRSSIKKYGRSIIIRSKVRRQTDRQTAQNNISTSSITTCPLEKTGEEEHARDVAADDDQA